MPPWFRQGEPSSGFARCSRPSFACALDYTDAWSGWNGHAAPMQTELSPIERHDGTSDGISSTLPNCSLKNAVASWIAMRESRLQQRGDPARAIFSNARETSICPSVQPSFFNGAFWEMIAYAIPTDAAAPQTPHLAHAPPGTHRERSRSSVKSAARRSLLPGSPWAARKHASITAPSM